MLQNKWWFKKGLLTSGLDPGQELGQVADHIGDEYTPMLFMTGDGHRAPPFTWTTRGVWPDYFRDLAQMNKICCHVEKYSNAVVIHDVPGTLQSVFNNGKVFGWEPRFFRDLQEVMEICFKYMGEGVVPLSILGKIANTIKRVTLHGHLQKEADIATEYLMTGMALQVDPVPMHKLGDYDTFLGKFAGTRAMQLRTEIHAIVGATIQANIDRYADHVHLITCGDAHITCEDPLFLHIKPPIGTFGVVDENRG